MCSEVLRFRQLLLDSESALRQEQDPDFDFDIAAVATAAVDDVTQSCCLCRERNASRCVFCRQHMHDECGQVLLAQTILRQHANMRDAASLDPDLWQCMNVEWPDRYLHVGMCPWCVNLFGTLRQSED